jgi:hypothetical protein
MDGVRWTRLRWRLRGAWQWPTFVALTLVEAVLLNELPVWGDGAEGFLPGLLLAGFLNLFVVAVLAPFAGRLLRRRRPDLPRPIASDYAGSGLLVALLMVLVVAGLLHRPALDEERSDRAAQAAAVAHYVASQAPEYEPGLRRLDTMQVDRDVYRSCVPGRDPKRWLCLFVDTDQSPPGVTRDPDRSPNSEYRRGGFD